MSKEINGFPQTAKTTSRVRELLAGLCFLAAIVLFIALFSALLMPKREDGGSNWGAFLLEKKNSLDIMFFGSSLVYCDVVPAVIYEASACTSYIMAGPEQTLPMTYYYLKEAYRTQNPALVFVEISGVFFPQYTDYAKVNIGYMPWSINRLAATFMAADSKEWMGLLFPLYDYHELWKQMSLDNLLYSVDYLAGYSPLTEIDKWAILVERKVDFNRDVFEQNIACIKTIAQLCANKGSQVIFYITPSYYPWQSDYMLMLEEELASIPNIEYIDFNKRFAELNIDDTVDFFDLLHFNVFGAQKFSSFLSNTIQSRTIGNRDADRNLWNERVLFFARHYK